MNNLTVVIYVIIFVNLFFIIPYLIKLAIAKIKQIWQGVLDSLTFGE